MHILDILKERGFIAQVTFEEVAVGDEYSPVDAVVVGVVDKKQS